MNLKNNFSVINRDISSQRKYISIIEQSDEQESPGNSFFSMNIVDTLKRYTNAENNG